MQVLSDDKEQTGCLKAGVLRKLRVVDLTFTARFTSLESFYFMIKFKRNKALKINLFKNNVMMFLYFIFHIYTYICFSSGLLNT